MKEITENPDGPDGVSKELISADEPVQDGELSEEDVKHNVKVNVLLDAIYCIGAADYEVAYNPLYVYLKASNTLIGFLNSLGWLSIIGVILSPFISRRCQYKKWYLFVSHIPYILPVGLIGLAIIFAKPLGFDNPHLLKVVIGLQFVIMFFAGFVTLPHQEFLAACIPMRYRGRYTGISFSVGAIGSIISTSIGGVILANMIKPTAFGYLFLMAWFFNQTGYLMALFAREIRTPVEKSPMPWTKKMFVELWKDKPFMKVLALNLIYFTIIWPGYMFVPIYGYKILHMHLALAAVIVLIQQIFRFFCSAPIGILVDKFSAKRLLPYSFALSALVFLPIFLINNSYGVFIGSGLGALCFVGANACFNPLLFGTPSPENRSGHFSAQILIRNLIGTLGPLLFGFLADMMGLKNIFAIWIVVSVMLGLLAKVMLSNFSERAEDYA